MEAVAYLKYVRVTPSKVKGVLDLIRGKDVDVAMGILKNTPKAVCEDLIKLLKSATANAENNFEMDKDNLYISECFVCPGPPRSRRMNPRAKGSGDIITKRTSHITLKVKEQE